MGRKGYATVEASIAITLFLFAMLALLQLGFVMTLNVKVYSAFAQAGSKTAKNAYSREQFLGGESRTMVYAGMSAKLHTACRKDPLVAQYVKGGSGGILLTGVKITDDGFLEAALRYQVAVKLPFLSRLRLTFEEHIRQKMYIGYVDDRQQDTYVYITDHKSVYHSSRNCSHLTRDIRTVTRQEALRSGKGQCRYCGRLQGKYYMTTYGDCYHRSAGCPGVARLVQRVKKREVQGLGACSRCGAE